MGKLYDKTGREIMLGDVLKVFHFVEARYRRKNYMYKQSVGMKTSGDKTPVMDFSHLSMNGKSYPILMDGRVLQDYEIVQSLDCAFRDRPRIKVSPDA